MMRFMKKRRKNKNIIDNINILKAENSLKKMQDYKIYTNYLICLYFVFGVISCIALIYFY